MGYCSVREQHVWRQSNHQNILSRVQRVPHVPAVKGKQKRGRIVPAPACYICEKGEPLLVYSASSTGAPGPFFLIDSIAFFALALLV
jgi:hypothetical protein